MESKPTKPLLCGRNHVGQSKRDLCCGLYLSDLPVKAGVGKAQVEKVAQQLVERARPFNFQHPSGHAVHLWRYAATSTDTKLPAVAHGAFHSRPLDKFFDLQKR